MASKVQLYTSDGNWKVVIEAWARNFGVYESIGTSVTVYVWARQGGFLGLFPHYGWVEALANTITITNRYKNAGGRYTDYDNLTWRGKSHAELYWWHAGGYYGPPDYEILMKPRGVEGVGRVVLGSEVLQAVVTAP